MSEICYRVNEMNKLMDCFIKNCSADDMLLATYGIASDERFDCVFVAPSWTVDKVFDITKVEIKKVYEDPYSVSFEIQFGNKKYLYVKLQIGAPNIIDFCLLCYKLKCDNFVFVGAVGALVPEINVGDVIVPTYAISGNGATAYLCENLGEKKLFDKAYATPEFSDEIKEICDKKEMKPLDVPVISVDSIVAEYIHVEAFKKMGAKAIEMEAATFFEAMNYIKKNAAALLVVSDNSSTGKHLIGRTDEDKINYHKSRSKLADILLSL